MIHLSGNPIFSLHEILRSYHQLAALSAAALFVFEGSLLGILVFSRGKSAQGEPVRSLDA